MHACVVVRACMRAFTHVLSLFPRSRQGVSQAAWTTHEATCYRRNKYCERCGDVVQKNAFDKHIEEDHREVS